MDVYFFMQTLVVYSKSDRRVVATFKLNTFVTEMDVLMNPELSYTLSLKDIIFRRGSDDHYYLREERS